MVGGGGRGEVGGGAATAGEGGGVGTDGDGGACPLPSHPLLPNQHRAYSTSATGDSDDDEGVGGGAGAARPHSAALALLSSRVGAERAATEGPAEALMRKIMKKKKGGGGGGATSAAAAPSGGQWAPRGGAGKRRDAGLGAAGMAPAPPSPSPLIDAPFHASSAFASPTHALTLTARGRAMAALPLEPLLASFLLSAAAAGVGEHAASIVALLSADGGGGGVWVAPGRDRAGALEAARRPFVSLEGDAITLLNVARSFEAAVRTAAGRVASATEAVGGAGGGGGAKGGPSTVSFFHEDDGPESEEAANKHSQQQNQQGKRKRPNSASAGSSSGAAAPPTLSSIAAALGEWSAGVASSSPSSTHVSRGGRPPQLSAASSRVGLGPLSSVASVTAAATATSSSGGGAVTAAASSAPLPSVSSKSCARWVERAALVAATSTATRNPSASSPTSPSPAASLRAARAAVRTIDAAAAEWCSARFLSLRALRLGVAVRDQLADICAAVGVSLAATTTSGGGAAGGGATVDTLALRRALVAGCWPHVALRLPLAEAGGKPTYRLLGSGAGGVTVALHPSSSLTLAYSHVRNRTAAMAAAAAAGGRAAAGALGVASTTGAVAHSGMGGGGRGGGPSSSSSLAEPAQLLLADRGGGGEATAAAATTAASLAGGALDIGYPDAVVYAEVVVTGKAYMRNVTRVERSWLAEAMGQFHAAHVHS